MVQEEIVFIINCFFLAVGVSLLISIKIKSVLTKVITGIIFIVIGFAFLIFELLPS